jgi:hypothetical protein
MIEALERRIGSGTVSAFPSEKSFGKQVANSPATF